LAWASGERAGGFDVQMFELALATAPPAADSPQRMGAAEVTEQHGHELAPAGEAPDVALRVGPLDQSPKFSARKQLEEWLNMLENSRTGEPPSCGVSTLGRSSPPYGRWLIRLDA
jgi:hypothetical protein